MDTLRMPDESPPLGVISIVNIVRCTLIWHALAVAFLTVGTACDADDSSDSTATVVDDASSSVEDTPSTVRDSQRLPGVGLDDADTVPDGPLVVDCCDEEDASWESDSGSKTDVAASECELASECKDFDNCTDDLCVDGACKYPPIPGCCTADSACDDGIECTTDKCNFATLQCSNVPGDNLCCLDASDCNDFNACTTDTCVANQCIHPTTSSGGECGCVLDILCDDSNPCTVDQCISGVCTYDVAPISDGCCATSEDCSDDDSTTNDICVAGLCWNGSSACELASDCPSLSPCLGAECVEGSCSWLGVEDCCVTDEDCDDGHALTVDRCLSGKCIFALGSPIPCTTPSDCVALNGCVSSTCQADAGFCSVAPLGGNGCCTADPDCPSTPDGCGESVCDAFACGVANAQPLIPYWEDDFNAATLQWSVIADASSAKWQLATAQYISAGQSLYYGALPAMTISVGTTAGTVTSPVITPVLSSTVMLSFERNAAVEAITSVDKFWLEVVDEQTGVATEIWNKNYNLGPGLGWKSVLLDISAHVSGPFRMRFQFDSIDDVPGPINEGVYVDDVKIGTPCE